MINLHESGISATILQEFENALIENFKTEVEAAITKLTEGFLQRGYNKNDLTITTKMVSDSYELKGWLRIKIHSVDGSSNFMNVGHTWFKQDTTKSKRLNLAGKSILDFYATKANELIEETKSLILSSTHKDIKTSRHNNRDTYFLSVKGLAYYNNSYYFINMYINGRTAVDENTLQAINSIIENYENILKDQEERVKAAIVKKEEELRQWALKNGSELLQNRIMLGFNWFELANEEWLNSVMPAGFYRDGNDYDHCWEYNDPSLEHMKAFKAAEELDVLTNISLRKCQLNENEEDSTTVYSFIVGKITTFDGLSSIEVVKLLD